MSTKSRVEKGSFGGKSVGWLLSFLMGASLFCGLSSARAGSAAEFGSGGLLDGDSFWARAVSVGYLHNCVLTGTGGVKGWGRNEKGELGNNSKIDSSSPVDVSGLTSGVRAISCGTGYSCALTEAGGVRCWGWNDTGQLGDTTQTDRPTPVEVFG